MVDHLTKKMRSWNMSRIRSKDTKPEMIVRSLLHRMGYRFRLHRKNLPGKPDIVLPKYKTVIFVHGCFWHRHKNCKRCTTPTSNKEYWMEKFQKNIKQDKMNHRKLVNLRWNVIVIWECEVENLNKKLSRIDKNIRRNALTEY
jgi:DNA mismatch endonuclease, patch repair protein